MAQEHLFLSPYGTKIQTPAVVFETIFRAKAAGAICIQHILCSEQHARRVVTLLHSVAPLCIG
jgi:hypothetical protein